jgi:DNA invertase Pin-like site-specific DNA recombinase
MKLLDYVGMAPEPAEKPLRYVMYVRKSSEDAEAQAKSLPDQIAACKEYARTKGLLVVGEPIQESKSAKKSGNRPLFLQMLKDIEKGKYDGILAWHPDRLSRNSLEAGKIVDMVDNDTIKDLKFPTLEFTNDSSGKLLLNIMFAMSKQYSEHLSESVQRGVDSNFAQGKSSGVPKWGYNRDEATGLYKPDKNFDFIRHAWDMVIAGATRQEALEYLQAHDVHRMTKLTRKNKHPRRMDIGEHAMTTIFRDPFYYGVLVQAGHGIELKKVDPNFKPMVTEQEFMAVQAQTKERSRREITYFEPLRAAEKLFLPFRHLILCHECGHYMVVSRSRGRRGKYYMNARCMYEGCPRNPKGIRVGVILEDMYAELSKLHFTESQYEGFVKNMHEYIDAKMEDVLAQKRSLQAEKNNKQHQIDALAQQYADLGKDAPQAAKDRVKQQLNDKQIEMTRLDDELTDINEKIVDPSKLKLTAEKFLNPLNSLDLQMRATDMLQMDFLARKIFLNPEKNEEMSKNKMQAFYFSRRRSFVYN